MVSAIPCDTQHQSLKSSQTSTVQFNYLNITVHGWIQLFHWCEWWRDNWWSFIFKMFEPEKFFGVSKLICDWKPIRVIYAIEEQSAVLAFQLIFCCQTLLRNYNPFTVHASTIWDCRAQKILSYWQNRIF